MNESIFVLNYGFENSSKEHVFHVSNNFSLANDFDFRASLRDQQVHSLTTQIKESNTIISCKIAN